MPEVFEYYQGTSPVLVSIPHDGAALPADVLPALNARGRSHVDRDWYVSQLYSFLQEDDISFIRANYSRYVVDLNRSPEGELLYPGQTETPLGALTTFDGDAIYNRGKEPTNQAIRSRIDSYWQPYHDHIRQELARLKALHGYAHLWDAHSIRARVPVLFEGQLPDLNFGSADGRSCAAEIPKRLMTMTRRQSNYSYILNGRFKGGYITRCYGDPAANIHALQLEINQDSYMDCTGKPVIDERKRQALSSLLRELLGEFKKPG